MTLDWLKTRDFFRARKSEPTAVESGLSRFVSAQPSQAISVEGYRGARMRFVSNGANNETGTWTMYAIDQQQNGGWHVESLGTLAITLGTATGVSPGTGIPVTERFADTLTWTPTTWGSAMLTYVGGNAAAYSPADNTIAEFLISDFGNCSHVAFLITTYGLAAGSTANVLMKLDR